MLDSNLFPGVVQFGFDTEPKVNPPLHLILTIWLKTTSREVVLPVNSNYHGVGRRLAYFVFKATGVIQAGHEAFQLSEVCLTRPPGLNLLTSAQIYSGLGFQSSLEVFLKGIAPHG